MFSHLLRSLDCKITQPICIAPGD